MVMTSWLIGSTLIQEQSYSLGGGLDLGFPAGEYSLLAMMNLLLADMTSEGFFSPAVVLCRDRLIRISASSSFSIEWNTTELRDLLGFTGDLSGASSYTAAYPSGLLFSPGYPATRPVSEGCNGYSVEDQRIEIDRSGTIVNTTCNHSQTWDELSWSGVVASRVVAVDPTAVSAGGTWRRFRRLVLVPNYAFFHVELVDEDGTSAAASLSSSLGQYKCRELPADYQDRRIRNANSRWNFGVKVLRVGN